MKTLRITLMVSTLVVALVGSSYAQQSKAAAERSQREWEQQQQKQQQMELENQQRELDQQRRELNNLRNEQQSQRVADDIASQERAKALELEKSIASMERAIKAGYGLTDAQVEWVKAAGYLGRNVSYSEYRPFTQRLYSLYYAEKARRGK